MVHLPPASSHAPVVLVGTDFSETAALALAEAGRLAARLDGTLRVVHVRGVSEREWRPDGVARAWLAGRSTDCPELEVRKGTPWVELSRVAEECDAAFVVVGTHGRTGVQPVALGSTAARISLASSRPVVLVNGRTSPSRSTPEGV